MLVCSDIRMKMDDRNQVLVLVKFLTHSVLDSYLTVLSDLLNSEYLNIFRRAKINSSIEYYNVNTARI